MRLRHFICLPCLVLALGCLVPASGRAGAEIPPPLPATLAQTGLYAGDDPARVDPAHLSFAPQYPLWSDGTHKQRWLSLPAGKHIDASNPNAWAFPPGTRLWKTFAYSKPVETRLIERLADGRWRFAAYVWDAAGREARLAPAEGIPDLPVPEAPGGRYAIPSREDCLACHGGTTVPVLGLGIAQLSSDRDPNAPHAAPDGLTLEDLVRTGQLTGLPADVLRQPPIIPAATADERAALGYLHGNCGHCHNRSGRGVPVALNLAMLWRGGTLDSGTVLRSAIGRHARYASAGEPPGVLLQPGDTAASLVSQRMRSRDPRLQMPPLGTQSIDATGLALVERWISTMPTNKETPP